MTLLDRISRGPPWTEAVGVWVGPCLSDRFEREQVERLHRSVAHARNIKMRPLDIPCMSDRAMQALYLLALEPIAETRADPNSYGFRPGRATADAIQQCHIVLCRARSASCTLEGDI